MSEENDKGEKVDNVIKVVSGLVDKVPIYQDAVQPAAKEVGKGLEVMGKAINAALIPIEGFIWGMEKIRTFVEESATKKLKDVPPKDIQTPNPHVAIPTIEALRYIGEVEQLCDLYENLLATSMDKATAYRAHPSFADMIKNMCPDEGRIMKYLKNLEHYPLVDLKIITIKDNSFSTIHKNLSLLGIESKCEHVPLTPTYIDNLQRLGLIVVDQMSSITDVTVYEKIEKHTQVKKIIENLEEELILIPEKTLKIERLRLIITQLGKQFIRTCIINKNDQPRN